MSCIAWDGRILAADKMGTNNGRKYLYTKFEILSQNSAMAFVGVGESGLLLFEWYKNGAKKEEWPDPQKSETDYSVLIVAVNGECFDYHHHPIAKKVESKYHAWGSGGDFAIGAMHHGANSIEAVLAAIDHSDSCGFGVDSQLCIKI